MADFKKILEKVLEHEGGYANDWADRGGETYCGISRVHFPSWSGWPIIDAYSKSRKTPADLRVALKQSTDLVGMVRSFYRLHFWDRFQGDKIPVDELALELMDTAVNMGVHQAVLFLQKALNVLNRDELSYPDIVEDGGFGSKTNAALEQFLNLDSVNLLCKVINIMQGARYLEIMRKSLSQERFARGWFNRVAFGRTKGDH